MTATLENGYLCFYEDGKMVACLWLSGKPLSEYFEALQKLLDNPKIAK